MPAPIDSSAVADEIQQVSLGDNVVQPGKQNIEDNSGTIGQTAAPLAARVQTLLKGGRENKVPKVPQEARSNSGDSGTNSVRSFDATPDLTHDQAGSRSSAYESQSDINTPLDGSVTQNNSYFPADPRLVRIRLDQIKRASGQNATPTESSADDNSVNTSSRAVSRPDSVDESQVPGQDEALVGRPVSRRWSITASDTNNENSDKAARASLRRSISSSQLNATAAAAAAATSTESDHHDWFADTARPKALVAPSAGPAPVVPGSTPHQQEGPIDIEDPESASAGAAVTVDEVATPAQTKGNYWPRFKAWYRRVYCPTESPPLVLPTAPTDAEKVLYLKTNRLGLHGIGVLAFCSLSAGMWLFVLSSVAFYWFGAFVAFLQLYMIVSYLTSVCGGEFNMEEHNKILAENPIDPVTAPDIDIYLPVCKEPMVILENTWNHVSALQYPEGKIKVWVLDDGADDNVKALATKFGYNYIVRDNRPHLKKAGNLRYAFARTEAPFFSIFDADFCPRPDFLLEIMPEHLANPDTCIVQTPQFFRTTTDQSWVEQGAGAIQEVFYRVVQTNRNKWGASVCVGSNAIYRRESLVEVGGTAEIGFSEDVHTGFYAMCRGWKLRYLPLCLACGVCPDTPRAYFSQQMRWAMGSTTLVTNPEFWKSPLNRMQKICFLCGLLYYSAVVLSIFMAPLPGMLLIWIRPEYVRYYNLAFAVPSVLYGLIIIRAWAKAEYGFNVQFIQQIQMYAYAAAIKKRILGRGLTWVASGDSKVHKSNEFREMRIVAWVWNTTIVGLTVAGIVYQTLGHRLHWYDTIPLLVLTAFNLFLAHRFLLWAGKI